MDSNNTGGLVSYSFLEKNCFTLRGEIDVSLERFSQPYKWEG
jgi:hypothetical protein